MVGWVNTRDAGDLIRHRANYDVTVMEGSGRYKAKFWDQHAVTSQNSYVASHVETQMPMTL